MRIIKKFENFKAGKINEAETDAPVRPDTRPETRPDIDIDKKPTRPDRERIERPSIEPDPKARFGNSDRFSDFGPKEDDDDGYDFGDFGDLDQIEDDNFNDDDIDDDFDIDLEDAYATDDIMDDVDLDDLPSNSYGEEEEEAGDYKGTVMMNQLADMLGADVVNNQIDYKGKKINFYSETEMFHIGKEKFETPEEAYEYLTGGMSANESLRWKRNRRFR